MSDKNKTTVDKLIIDIKKYVELQGEYYRIQSLEKVAASTSFTLLFIIVVLFIFFSFLFFNIFIAVLIAYLYSRMTLDIAWVVGFSSMLGIYLLATLFLIFRWKNIKSKILNRFTNILVDSIKLDKKTPSNGNDK